MTYMGSADNSVKPQTGKDSGRNNLNIDEDDADIRLEGGIASSRRAVVSMTRPTSKRSRHHKTVSAANAVKPRYANLLAGDPVKD